MRRSWFIINGQKEWPLLWHYCDFTSLGLSLLSHQRSQMRSVIFFFFWPAIFKGGEFQFFKFITRDKACFFKKVRKYLSRGYCRFLPFLTSYDDDIFWLHLTRALAREKQSFSITCCQQKTKFKYSNKKK